MLKLVKLLAAVSPLLLVTVPAWSAGSDELWDMTFAMDMGGMTMPSPTIKSCIPKGGQYKPEDKDKSKNCKLSDYKISGNTVSWKMECTGKEAMTGSGEITKTATAMKGVFNMHTHEMDMTQNISGKLVGTCDAAEQRQKMNKVATDIKQRVSDTTRQTCESSMNREVESGGYGEAGSMLFHGDQLCASYQPQLCTQARAYADSYKGYATYVNKRGAPEAKLMKWGWVLADCKIDLDKSLPKLCKQAVAEKAWRFVGGYCPAEAQALSDQSCAEFGMARSPDYSKPNGPMCLALRSKGANGGSPGDSDDVGSGPIPSGRSYSSMSNDNRKAAPAQDAGRGSDNPAAQAMDAVKKLKGMFGF